MYMTRQIIEYIKEHSVSVEELARETGVEYTVLSGAERPLNAAELLEVCRYLNLDPWYLFVQSRD